jgi:hypothetical protein
VENYPLRYNLEMKLSKLTVNSVDYAAEATTVGHLAEALAPPILRVLAATRGLDTLVNGTVLHDQLEPLPQQPGAVLLLSGLRTDSSEAQAIVSQASDYEYSAVVVKRRDSDASELVTTASARGLVILAAADEIPWQQLDALILSVLGAQGLEAMSATGSGGELFAIANAVASVIGGSVSIEGIDRRLLAYSSVPNQRIDSLRQRGILDRRVPDMDRNLSQYRSVLAADGVVRFPEAPDEFARSAIAIRAGARPLGTIWAIEELGETAGDGERVLRDAARLAALHLLRGRSPSLMELEVKEATLKAALDGSLAPEEVAYRLGLGSGATLALIGFAAAPDSKGVLPLISHIGNALTRYVAAFRPDAAIATTSRAVYVLLPSGGLTDPDLLASGALSAIRQVFDDGMRAAIAAPFEGVAALADMRKEVDDILRVITQQSDLPAIAKLVDVHSQVLLSHISDELERHPRLRHPGVIAMVAHDLDHKTDYASSVAAWLDAVGDIAVASESLHVHPNTLRYRLRRMGELFGVTLDDPNERLSVWLQLRTEQLNRRPMAAPPPNDTTVTVA